MKMDIIKWDESMAVRCIARHNAYLPQAWRNSRSDRDEAPADPEAEEDDDYRWTVFSEKIKKLAAKR